MSILSEQTFPAALDDRLRDAYGVTAELLSDIVSETCRRFPSNGGNAKAARVERLIQSQAWTDAALALIDLELPQWQVRRLAYDEREWYCALSRERELPDDEYPMVLSTGRVLEHWHTGSMTRRASLLDQIEPEAVAFMTPKDMRRMKLAPGDFIRLETRRGAVEVKVRSDRDVPENMVFMPFCYAEAAANLLTNPALDPFGKIPEFKFCAVRAERAEIRTAAE